MEWLSFLLTNPAAFDSFTKWISEQIQRCNSMALDLPLENIPQLKGQREAYLAIVAYVQNNKQLTQRKDATHALLESPFRSYPIHASS